MDTKREVINGYMYVSSNGQLVIDRHPTDKEHLLAAATRTEQPLHDCRTYVSDLVPKEWHSRRGQFLVYRITNDAGEILALQLALIPFDTLVATPPASPEDLQAEPSR